MPQSLKKVSYFKTPDRAFDPLPHKTEIITGAVHLVGFEFDGTACFRKGTKHGPNAIRNNTYDIETYSPYQDRDTTDVHGVDLGNLPVGSGSDPVADFQMALTCFENAFADIDLNQIAVLTLGGEHSISYAPIKTYLTHYPDLVLIQLDAHADLRNGYEGFHYSHASIMRRSLDLFGPNHTLMQYGIRSGTREEFQFMNQQKTLFKSRKTFFEAVQNLPDKRPIYLTLDLDFFDPAFMPGTGTPEAGGEDFLSLVAFLDLVENKNLVGADIVELSPPIDTTGNSDSFASKVAREILLSLNAHIKGR